MSQDLIWQLVRKNNSFLVKRDGISLSAEPGNLTNLHSFKYSGLANNKTIHIEANNGKIAAYKKLRRGSRKPAVSTHMTALNKARKNKENTSAKNLITLTAGYRADLTRAAVARYHALTKAGKVAAGTGVNNKQRRTKTIRKNAQ